MSIRVDVTITDEKTGKKVVFPGEYFESVDIKLPKELTWRGIVRALSIILEVPEGSNIFTHAAAVNRRAKRWVTDTQNRVLEDS